MKAQIRRIENERGKALSQEGLPFITQSSAAIAIFDRDMRYICASRRWRADHGLGEGNLEGLSHDETFSRIPEKWKEDHRRALDGETVHGEEDCCEGRDGSLRWLRREIQPWVDELGAVGGIAIFTEDMTEKKQMEKDLAWESEASKCLADLSVELLETTSVKQVSDHVLQSAQKFTGSPFGYIGHIDTQSGPMIVPAYTPEVWGHCRIDDKPVSFERFTGLWGGPLHSKEPLLTNDAAADPRACGLPEGHLRIHRLLTVPVLCGERLVGQIALANPDRDFTQKDLDLVERLAAVYALIIQKREAEKALQARIADLGKTQKTLESEREFLQTIIDGVADPILVIGLDRRVLMLNLAAKSHLGGEADEHSACFELLYRADKPCDLRGKTCLLEKVRTSGQAVTVVTDHLFERLGQRTFELQATPFRNEEGEIIGIIKASRDITERLKIADLLQKNQRRLRHLAYHDPLTELPNRLFFREHLTGSIALARRAGSRLAVLLLDLDRFKNINDSLGHRVGDKVLCEVADRLRYWLRQSDFVARLGGDEFGIILDQVDDINRVSEFARRLLSILPQPIHVENLELTVAGSLGISIFPADAEEEEKLIRFADAAMYSAKNNGGNSFQFHTPGMNARSDEFLRLETALRKALGKKQFLLHFQPVVDLDQESLVGVEALLRWNHPDYGLVSPADFIPLAEETGLIVPIGEWVLEQTCNQAILWQEQGLPPLRMGVNISSRQFREPDFVDTVDRILAKSGLEPCLLELEITESMVMENVEKAIMTLSDLRARGLCLSIDDFGTGYSSLSYLKRFPIHSLKIDRSFIQGVTTDPNDSAISSSIIALAHSMGLKVVGEGIETEEQLWFLKEKGCDMGQGYLFSRPLPAEQAARKIHQWVESEAILSTEIAGAATR